MDDDRHSALWAAALLLRLMSGSVSLVGFRRLGAGALARPAVARATRRAGAVQRTLERKAAYLDWYERPPHSAVALVRSMHVRTTTPP